MASSSRVARALPIALLALVALVSSAGVLSGCAHAGAAPARAAAAPLGSLDPSEEITPEELASIPEPVPAASRAAAVTAKPTPKAPDAAAEPRSSGGEARPPIEPAPEPAPPPAPPPAATPEPAAPVAGGSWVWRVQILATPDRALAERVAGEATERLGTTSRIDSEPPFYKVRLGGFASEADAQILKARAVEMGYPGAFRVKIGVAVTDK